jgi:UDP-N-acetylglucosamine 3-dehydrogenase
MSEVIGIGVIGVGTFGTLHAQVYQQMDGAELVAVADVNEARLREVGDALGVEGYTDYKELLARKDVAAVSICTTDELHVAPALAAAETGKHMLIEKPLALTPDDCDTIIAAAEEAEVRLMVGHILRFDPRYYAAHQEIAAGGIGDLLHLYIRRNNVLASAQRLSAHTSVLFFLGIHDLDYILWCAGALPERVYAQSVSRLVEGTPDAVQAILTFPGGTVASLEASWVLPERHPRGLDARFDAVGTAGAVYVNGSGDDVSVIGERVSVPSLFYAPELIGRRVGILPDELAHFCQCVREGRQPLVGGGDGRAAVRVACAIQASYESGAPVTLENE